jgi:hypothetical protein
MAKDKQTAHAPDASTVGYVVVDFNRDTGKPSFAWNDEIHSTVTEAADDAEQARGLDRDEYAVAELRLIEKPRAGSVSEVAA